MQRCHILCLTLLAAAASSRAAGPDIGMEWGAAQFSILAVGDMTSDAGLECVGEDQLATLAVYRLADGSSLDNIPAAFNNPQTQFTLRDTDDDGLAEVLCISPSGFGPTRIGLLDLSGGLHRVWSDITITTTLTAVDFVDLSASEPRVIVLAARQLILISSQSGTILYESDDDPDIGSSWFHESMLIDDFDSDGNDEILATMGHQSTPGLYRSFLIGDRAAPTPVDDLGGNAVGRVVLGQSWPNPANGSTRIQFELGKDSRVRLRVFDAAGRLVRSIEDGFVPAGAHVRAWDGRDERGEIAASGIYFYELDVDGRREARKVVQLR